MSTQQPKPGRLKIKRLGPPQSDTIKDTSYVSCISCGCADTSSGNYNDGGYNGNAELAYNNDGGGFGFDGGGYDGGDYG